MDWISVNDELPECWSQHRSTFVSSNVLVYDDAEEYEITHLVREGFWDENGWNFKREYWAGYDSDETFNATHWMELPKKP